MRAQADDTERCRCEQLEIALSLNPARERRRILAVLTDALCERVCAEMAMTIHSLSARMRRRATCRSP